MPLLYIFISSTPSRKKPFHLPANPFCLSNKMLMKLFGLRALLNFQLFFETLAIKPVIKILSSDIALLSWKSPVCLHLEK